MTPADQALAGAEQRHREAQGILWDSRSFCTQPATPPKGRRLTSGRPQDAAVLCKGPAIPSAAGAAAAAVQDGAAYIHDGTLEGIFTAIHHALSAHDAHADLCDAVDFQARLGQECIPVATHMESALKARRLVEYCLGVQAWHCIRTACASDNPQKGNIAYRFIRFAVAASGRNACPRCAAKHRCVRACEAPRSSPILDDMANPLVYNLMALYRGVANECHRLEQFVRFEHREGDVWFARCNPNASVVPMLMDWFVPRFNDQRFVIYDENHALSGVYDGARWYLVGGDAISPPPQTAEEGQMQQAWRRFYRSVSVEARYHPELRRAFMPMRLWRNLTEMQTPADEAEGRWMNAG